LLQAAFFCASILLAGAEFVIKPAVGSTILVAEQLEAFRNAMTDWSQIVEQHGPQVWRTAQRLLRHEADAADCFQRTFIAALEISRKQTVRHWPALLRRIATARALEQLRQRVGMRARLSGDAEENGVERQMDRKSLGPDGAAQASELADHLRAARGKLMRGNRKCFVWRVWKSVVTRKLPSSWRLR
jgi:RNA polymerase sigma factor (sigma-70 family)